MPKNLITYIADALKGSPDKDVVRRVAYGIASRYIRHTRVLKIAAACRRGSPYFANALEEALGMVIAERTARNIPALRRAQVMKGYLLALNEGARNTATSGLERKVGDPAQEPPRTLRGHFNLQVLLLHEIGKHKQIGVSEAYDNLVKDYQYKGSEGAVRGAVGILLRKGKIFREKRGVYKTSGTP